MQASHGGLALSPQQRQDRTRLRQEASLVIRVSFRKDDGDDEVYRRIWEGTAEKQGDRLGCGSVVRWQKGGRGTWQTVSELCLFYHPRPWYIVGTWQTIP